MSFSEALQYLKDGHYIARAGWNGKGMYLFIVDGEDYVLTNRNIDLPHYSFIAMKTADNKVVPWLASQTDILSDDWSVGV